MKTNNKTHETKPSNPKSKPVQKENTPFAECIILKPVGYPFDFAMMENNLEIIDKALFEEYAREQWLGLVVKENSYLFDQKIIPDYGFQIVSLNPNKSIISENTKIKLLDIGENTLDTVKRVKTDVKLSDVVGQENAKNKTKVLIKYLENPDKFGPWAPKNILFYGFPGTGKTMLVKALANELDVPLYLIKATSLIGEHVGDSASKIQELFEKAQKTAPSIIFIDEIDAIALHRSFQSLRGDVAEIVNSLLTEMDGINENKAVITIGATNTPNSIDYAVRSRFEEEIEFVLPDDNERKTIFENNLKTFPLEYELNIEKLVKISKNMSGRDIKEKILKTALHHAISHDKEIVDKKDVEYALKASKIKNSEVKGMFE